MNKNKSAWDTRYTWVHYAFSFFYCGMIWWMMKTWSNPWLVILMLFCPSTLPIVAENLTERLSNDTNDTNEKYHEELEKKNNAERIYQNFLARLHENALSAEDVSDLIHANGNGGIWVWDTIGKRYIYIMGSAGSLVHDLEGNEYECVNGRFRLYQPLKGLVGKEK